MPSILVDSLADSLDRLAERLEAKHCKPPTFREFLESPQFCAESPSPVVAAIANASQGEAVTTLDAETVQRIFNCAPEALPTVAHRVVCVSAGGRGGKTSKLLAPRALHAAWTTPLRKPGDPADPNYPNAQQIAHGEVPVALLVGPKRKHARQAMSFVRGLVEASPVLRAAVVGEPGAESLKLRRPDGIVVEIAVATADKGGASVRGRTLVFCGLDEASFLGAEGAAVNDEDIFSAAIQRVVPYGQVWVLSTPWIEGEGLLERFIKSDWGRHQDALVVARVSTRLLNPSWDPDGKIEAAERKRPGGNENADREIEAIPLARGTKQFFPLDAIKRALELKAGGAQEERGAGVDLGHGIGNDNSALSVADRHEGGMFAPVLLIEIVAGTYGPSSTYKRFANELVDKGVQRVAGDPHYKETLAEELRKHGIAFVDAPARDNMYEACKTLLCDGRVALGHLPPEDAERLAEQLASVVGKPLVGGRTQILPPRKRVGDMGAQTGGHCDSVSALVAALSQCGSLDPYLWQKREPLPTVGYEQRVERAGGSGVDMGWLRQRSAGHSGWYRGGRAA